MKRIILLLIPVIMLVGLISFPATADTNRFSDISNHWAKAQIEQAVEKGYVSGFPDGTFRPDEPVTVAQFIAMMFLSFTKEDSSGKLVWSSSVLAKVPDWGMDNFYVVQDFSQGKPWYQNFVNAAITFGLIKDYEYEGRFDEPLTRERAAKIAEYMDGYFHGGIHDPYAELAYLTFKDYSKVEKGYKWNVGSAALRGIMGGYPDGAWKPKRWVTRAETISIMERMNNVSLRTPLKVNLTGVPYALVTNPGYDKQVYIFPNWEMKNVFDEMGSKLIDYPGYTANFLSQYNYFETEELKEKHLRKQIYLDGIWSREHQVDLTIAFATNVYELHLSAEKGRAERVSKTLDTFIGLVFNTSAAKVRKMIDDSMINHKQGKNVDIEVIIDNRQVVIESAPGGFNYLIIAISSYADR